MKYFYDTEFLEDGRTIKLISLGMIAEDGREFYAIAEDAPWREISEHAWLMENVIPSLPDEVKVLLPVNGKRKTSVDHPLLRSRDQFIIGILHLIGNDPFPQLWADFGAYDHVVLSQLWGTMIDKPRRIPDWTHDLRQECERHGNPEMPPQPEGHHNALNDAQWVKYRYEWLNATEISPGTFSAFMEVTDD